MKYYYKPQMRCPGFRIFLLASVCFAAGLPQLVSATASETVSACSSVNKAVGYQKKNCRYPRKRSWSHRETIVIAEDEVVKVEASDSGQTKVAVKGGYRHSKITNFGEINLQVSNTGAPGLPVQDNIAIDAIGIADRRGNDQISNHGLLIVAASTALTNQSGSAETYGIGIMGGPGDDRLINDGELNVTADAAVVVDDVTFSLINSGDARRQAVAIAEGITGNGGEDKIINQGQMNIVANATVDTSEFNLTLFGGPVDVDAGSEASATATGINSGPRGDIIDNQGTLTVSSNAKALSDNVSIDLITLPGAESLRVPLSAHAMAIGIDGDGGAARDDWIQNSGVINVNSTATADALDIKVTGLTLADEGANTTSESEAIGINGSADWDKIVNEGSIAVKANAITNSDTVDVSVFDLSFVPPLFGVESDQVVTTASSQATGIQAGDGDDKVVNNAALQVESEAKVDIDDYAVSLLGLAPDVSRTATAEVTGISGDRGDDYIKNNGQINVTSNAKLDLFGLSVDLVSLDAGVPGFTSDFEGSNQSLAYATGIEGGDGHDYLSSMGGLSVTAEATNNAWDLDFSAVKLSSADTSTSAEASATGIDGGKGRSGIHNSGVATVDANATTDTKSLSFTLIDLSLIPDAINLITGASGADTSTTARSDAVGITTGSKSDKIINDGSLTVTANSTTNTFEMSMSLDGVSNFTELGDFPDFFFKEPVVDASTTADASVIGITSGSGHDQIDNTGTLSTAATANVTATSIGVDLPLPELLPQILPNIDTTDVASAAKSDAVGIDTGDGHDLIKNSGIISSTANANANSLSINATIGAAFIPDPIDYKIPYSIEANLVDVGAQSDATATGVTTGNGNDYLFSSGDITAKAATTSNAINIAATVAYEDDKVSIGGSLANATTESKATATAIDTGAGDDRMQSQGSVLADASTTTTSTAVTVKLQATKDTLIGIGASATRANSEAETNSVGILLGDGNDYIYNEGSVTAKAHNNANAIGVDVGVTIPTGDKFGIVGEGNWVSTDTIATSTADGMTGGAGRDYISNSGTVVADSLARPNSVSVAANASGTKKGASIGVALTQAKTQGIASSNGISGGDDKDRLINSGTINSKAKSDTVAASVSASLALSDKGVALTGTAVDGATDATSTATGISGDEASDLVKNTGIVDVLADSNAVSGSVSVSAQGANKGVALGLALSRATSTAESSSIGISGGMQDDDIYSSGSVKSHGKALVIAGSLAVAGGGTSKGLTVEGAAADGSTTGMVTASGISGDEGNDHIVNKGDVDVLADADATSVSVGITANGTGTGATIGIALARATSNADADSDGIEGGLGNDHILSSGTVKSHANALVIAGSGALAGGGAGKGVSAQGVGVDAQTSGSANAQGISGGEGRDYILAEEVVDVFSDTSTTSIGVAVTANGTGTGLTFGLGLARAGAEGEAISIGISGGDGDDVLLSNNLINSHAKSLVIAGSGGLAVGGTGKGVTITGAAVDAASNGQVTAEGVSGGSGKDIIVNQNMVDVLADVDTTSAGLAVTANGSGAGLNIGIGLARATTIANADSTGIGGGEDDDQILNNGLVKSHATSDVIAGSAGLAGTFAAKGVAISGAAADASTLGNAIAAGIRGGLGVDEIFNNGDLDVLADSAATSVSVGASAAFTAAGVGLGVSLARTDTKADAISTGISLGGEADEPEELVEPEWKKYKYRKAGMKDCRRQYGHRKYNSRWNRHKHCSGYEPEPMKRTQIVVNNGKITSEANADADSVSVSVQLGFTGAGVQAGAALADASTRATADSKGIEGSNYRDIIVNQNSIDSIAGADATTTSVGVNFNAGVKALTLGVALTDATANANASSIGIAGLGGDDKIGNSGDISATSSADTNAVAVSVPISLSIVPLSAAFADADAEAIADANAINGGTGNDYLESSGVLLADASSNADGISVSVAPIGVALVGANITAEANAVGVKGEAGDDVILQKENASLTANSKVTATGTTIAATVLGVAGGFDNKSTAISQSTGISGGSGNNLTVNQGSINTDASSEATGTSVSAALTGVTIANTTTVANTDSTGISGGGDRDLILNQGSILVAGSSKTTGTSVGASVDPVSFADTTSSSVTRNTGISGGGGDDVIINLGSIDVTGSSTATGTSVGVALRYAAFADASTSSTTRSTGISGDAGLDNLLNLDSIKTKADTTATGTSVSAGLAGATFADSNTDATSYSTGISAGAGLDKILNLGSIETEANSTATGTTVSATLAGASFADLASNAESNAVGIATGTGEDLLVNKAGINAIANATANGTSVAAGLLGFFDGDASTTVTANATGIDLGSGNDAAFSEGAINIAANSNSKVTTGTGALAGAAIAKVNTTSSIGATGIYGGEGNDLIINKGSIAIGSGSVADPWMSSLNATGFSLTIAGAAIAESSLFAKTESTGLHGGTGDDRIFNAGDLDITATSYSSTSNTSIGIFGAAGNEAGSGAISGAAGISGGDGLNTIQNTAFIDVTAKSAINLNASSYTFAGASASASALAAQSNARGVMGGSDADFIESAGIIRVDADSNMTSSSNTDVTFGSAASNVTSGSVSTAMGVDGGDGDDVIRNFATVNVSSTSSVNSNNSAYAFGGGSRTDASMTGKAESVGLHGGSGADEIYNKGTVLADAIANISTTGGVKTTFGDDDASGLSVASAMVKGIDGAEGDDIIVSEGSITVTAFADATSTNNAESGWLIGDGETGSFSKSTVSGFGIVGGEGANTIQNRGDIAVNTSGIAYSFAYASGAHLSWDGDGESLADSRITSNAVGISAGHGNNAVINEGKMTILAEASTVKTISTTIRFWSEEENPDENSPPTPIKTVDSKELPDSSKRPEGETIFWTEDPRSGEEGYVAAYRNVADSDGNLHWVHINGFIVERTIELANAETYAAANGNGVTGTGKATAKANSSASAYGIKLGDGDNQIWNKNEMSITASPEAMTHVTADGDAFGDAIGTTRSNTYARAIGISAGAGNNLIANDATINVTASPVAKAHSEVSGGDICIWFFGWWCGGGGDGIGSAVTTFDSLAVGIMTEEGQGRNEITNNGTLNVLSSPLVSGFSTSVEGDASPAFSTSVLSRAVGIWTKGAGESRILNKGEINVTARDLPINYSCSGGTCSKTIEAVGIWTGDGNDHVFNEGSIVVDANGSAPIEVAIRTSAGDDMVVLGENSSVTGAIELGDDDDALHIFNTPVVNGSINGGNGADTAVFIGTGTFSNVLTGFETAVKQGAGTYTLPTLPSMENITIEEGLLEIGSNYQLAGGTAITPSVSSGVGQGSIVINGTLDISDGKIDIVIGSGHHLDGDRQSVITASEGIVNALSANNINLPEPSPLLTFYDEMTASELNISSSVKPFVTVASTSNEEAIASYMDGLLPDAEGDVSLALGEIQVMADGEHSAAFSSLSPETHVNSQQALEIGVRHHMSTLRQRTRGLRRVSEYDGFVQPGFVSSRDVLLTEKSDSHLHGVKHLLAANLQQTRGWVKRSLQDGRLDQTAANTGFEFDGSSYTFGFDQRLGAHKVIGLSVANNTTNVSANSNQSNSDIDSQLVSAYSGIINDTGYVNGMISSAYNIFETNRKVTVGAINSTVVSEHSGNVYSASLEGGLFIPASRWQVEAYGALHYQRHEEEGFREQGAGGIGLDVKSRNSDSIGSELGLRFARQFEDRNSRLFTEFDIALLHELKDENTIRASFLDTPDSSFTVEAQDIDSDGISLGTGMTYLVGQKITAAAEFRSELREDYSDQVLSASMQYRFD